MKCIFLILKFMARLVYFFLKLLPTQNKVTMISRKNVKTSIDFKLLSAEIIRNDSSVKIVVLNHKIKNKFSHVFEIIMEMYHLATSRVCIVDSYVISISILNHKENLIIIQIWHALGAIKQFGYAILDKLEGSTHHIAEIMDMHKNYTYITCGSKAMVTPYAKAFNVNEQIIKPFSMPRVDYLLNKDINIENRAKIFDTYKNLNKKKNIIYAPTFRSNEVLPVNDLIGNIDFEKFNLIIKKHPLDKTDIQSFDSVIVEDKFDILELLSVADYLITDYSAVSIEASILEIPMFFYVYDIESYKHNRGLFIDYYKEMPGVISEKAYDIMKAIETNDYNIERIREFKQKYNSTLDSSATKKIFNLMGIGEVYNEGCEKVFNRDFKKILMD
jgi:CDP-ribitol ribitolphosphotransferase / teichoic acid ribitol-phosphate polymerase